MSLDEMRDAMISYWKKGTDRKSLVDSLFEYFEKPRDDFFNIEMNNFCIDISMNTQEVIEAKITEIVGSLPFKSKQHCILTIFFLQNSNVMYEGTNEVIRDFIDKCKTYSYNRIMQNDFSKFYDCDLDKIEFFRLAHAIISDISTMEDLIINLYVNENYKKYFIIDDLFKVITYSSIRSFYNCEHLIEQLSSSQIKKFINTLAFNALYEDLPCDIFIKKCIEYDIDIPYKYEFIDSDKLSEENRNYLLSLSGPVEYDEELLNKILELDDEEDVSFTKMCKILYNDENSIDRLIKDLNSMMKAGKYFQIEYEKEDKPVSRESLNDLIIFISLCSRHGGTRYGELCPNDVTCADIDVDISDLRIFYTIIYLYQYNESFFEIIKDQIDKLALPTSFSIELMNETSQEQLYFDDDIINDYSDEARNFVMFSAFYAISSSYEHNVEIPFKGKLFTFFCIYILSKDIKPSEKVLSIFESEIIRYLDQSSPNKFDFLICYIKNHADSKIINASRFYGEKAIENRSFLDPDFLNYARTELLNGGHKEIIKLIKNRESDAKSHELDKIMDFIHNFFDIGTSLNISNIMNICKKLMKVDPYLLDDKEDDIYEYLEKLIESGNGENDICEILDYLAPREGISHIENRFDFNDNSEETQNQLFAQNPRFWKNFNEIKDKIICNISYKNYFKDRKQIFKHVKDIELFKQTLIKNQHKSSDVKLKINQMNLIEATKSEFESKINRDSTNFYIKNQDSKEFVTNISKIIFNPDFGLFVSTPSKKCLFPNKQNKSLEMFRFAGKFASVAFTNMNIINASLCNCLFDIVCGREIKVSSIKLYDEEIFNSLKYIYENDVSDLDLRFLITIDGKDTDLIENGSNIEVNEENKRVYISNYIDALMINEQVLAFVEGFNEINTISDLEIMNSDEIRKSLLDEEEII